MTNKKEISIDLNADLGEHPGSDLDSAIMPYLSSCNIACGGHIGDKESIRETMFLAEKYGVTIGAHPSFPDKENFGRALIEITQNDLKKAISDQIRLTLSVAYELGIKLHHVKPHGALYNQAAKDESTSILIGEVIREIDPTLRWMGLAHSISENVAQKLNIQFIPEAFADRRYTINRTLKPRTFADSMIVKEAEVLKQVEELTLRGRVYVTEWISINAQSICLHGDTSGAVNLAKRINEHLVSKGVYIHSV